MAKYVNAKQLARRFMSKGKDKIRLSTIINEIEIAEKGLSLEINAVEVVRCKDCKHCECVQDQFKNEYHCCTNAVNKAEVKPDGFCNYGERKGDE